MSLRSKEEYAKKLRDPRWQRMRLEVMQRDEFTCQSCMDTETTLNVHHNYYLNIEPWEYPLTALVTLCETCHQDETQNRKMEEDALLSVLRDIGFKATHINGLTEAMASFGPDPQWPDHWDYYLCLMIRHFHDLRPAVLAIDAEKRKERMAQKSEAAQ